MRISEIIDKLEDIVCDRGYNATIEIEKEDVINIIKTYFNTMIELSKTVNCNNCKGRESCLFKPEPGQLIRYNCAIPKLLNITRSIRDE